MRCSVTTTAGGTLSVTLDRAGASAQIQSGQTWRFQTWFRDPAGGGTGFPSSEGLAVDFQ